VTPIPELIKYTKVSLMPIAYGVRAKIKEKSVAMLAIIESDIRL
jgi:hypothetical protein